MLRVIRLHQIVIAGILGGLEWGRPDYGHDATEVYGRLKLTDERWEVGRSEENGLLLSVIYMLKL